MPASPAWPPKSLPRLFLREPLGEGASVDLDAGQANYLGNVMRLGVGSELLVFDGAVGRMAGADRRSGEEADDARRRAANCASREAIPDVWLAFAPVKRTQTDWLVEKATELGVGEAPAGDHSADDSRAREARTLAGDRDRSRRAMRTDGAARDRRAGEPEAAARGRDPERRLYFADEGGGEPAATASRPARR